MKRAAAFRFLSGATLTAPLWASMGCTHLPRPAVMAEADHSRQAPAAQEAAPLAPEAFAHAEKLRREAEAAYRSEDLAGAQILT
jgi:hypothetical protein